MDALLAAMSAAQLRRWMAYAELEPFGPVQDDYRAGAVWAAVRNAWSTKGGSKPQDAFPSLRPRKEAGPRRQSVEDQKLMAMQIAVAFGGTIVVPGAAEAPRKG